VCHLPKSVWKIKSHCTEPGECIIDLQSNNPCSKRWEGTCFSDYVTTAFVNAMGSGKELSSSIHVSVNYEKRLLTTGKTSLPDAFIVKDELIGLGLMEAYQNRPAYQQNDYIGWITRARQEKTRQKRLKIMLDEIASGKGYMGLKYIVKKSGSD